MANIASMTGMKKIISLLISVVLLTGCTNDNQNKPTDTLVSGTIDIAVDETYRPVIEQQLIVFDSSFPDAHINVHYKSETECISDFLNEKVKMILVTRELSAEEMKLLAERKVVPSSLPIAKDAVAVIVNNASEDTLMSKSMIQGILTGTYKKKYTVVVDNQGSSTVRYMLDSLIPGEKLGANVFAAKGHDSVINYVANNPGAIGFVGVSYVSDFTDQEGLAFIKTVKVVSVMHDSLQKFYEPYQAFIAPEWYPLTRKLYYIHRETYPGLATGLATFLSKERGQLIFKQARLFPLRTNIIFRTAEINEQ